MARFVDEIMNRELFSLGPNDPAARALEHLLSLGITSAPVLDRQRRPIGVASLRDLIPARAGATVHDRLTAPPIALGPRDSI